MAKTSPAEFVRQVRQEVAKVAFPTRKETVVSVVAVIVMVAVASLFFLITDSVIQSVVGLVLGYGR